MSVSPTDDALIVALDFEGEFDTHLSKDARYHLRMDKNRCTQSRTFGSGGHASRSLQYCYF
jgi:hypothetical protein